jgi:hypothetical protein
VVVDWQPSAFPVMHHVRRPGELTARWRFITCATWGLIVLAYGLVWVASRRLGLSTWWLGAASDPQPALVSMLPFLPPVAMVAATFGPTRWLPWWGLGAAACGAAVAAFDAGRVPGFAVVEAALAASGAATSVASWSGMFRRPGGPHDPTVASDHR